ncbi:MAG: hypothetical protein ABI162_06415 [Luteolibacter sp.]
MKASNKIVALGMSSLIALQMTAVLQAATKTTTMGNSMFGATLTGTFDQALYGSTYDVFASGRADGKLLYLSVNLASGASNFRVDGTNRTSAWGNLKAAGYTLATWNKSFSNNASFTTAPFVSFLPGGSATFSVGPVPITVGAGGSVIIYAQGTVATGLSSNGKPVVTANFGPVADVGAWGSVGIGVPVAEIGVRGSLSLCHMGISASVNMFPSYGKVYANYAATLNSGAPSGSLCAYAKIGYGWLSYTATKDIFTWNGSGGASYSLASGSVVLQ